jgi:hypothetical protein
VLCATLFWNARFHQFSELEDAGTGIRHWKTKPICRQVRCLCQASGLELHSADASRMFIGCRRLNHKKSMPTLCSRDIVSR